MEVTILFSKNKSVKCLKLKLIIFSIFIFLIVCLLIIITSKSKDLLNSKSSYSSIDKISDIKISIKDSIINKVHNTNKIIPLELELSQSVSIDNSWGDLGILKKYKNITYFATCSYMIDLSKISSNDIFIDSINKTISITVPKPEIYLIDFNYDKIQYEESINGLLRFGDILIRPEDSIQIENDVKTKLEEKMLEYSLYSKSTAASKESISNLLKQILDENFDVSVNFS